MEPLCRHEEEVSRCLRTGNWDAAVLEHVQQCPACRGVREVAAWVNARAAEPAPEPSDAGARQLWRLARNARAAREDRAGLVLAGGRRLALVLMSLSALLAAFALRAPLEAALVPLALDLQSGVVAVTDLATRGAYALTALLALATVHLSRRALVR
jgi:hypothetical protein